MNSNKKHNILHLVAITAVFVVFVAAIAFYWYPPLGQTAVPINAGAPFLQIEHGAQVTDRVNVNTATAFELMVLPGIGEKKAQAIVDYREANGPFETVEDLMNVSGIGPKTMENLADKVTV